MRKPPIRIASPQNAGIPSRRQYIHGHICRAKVPRPWLETHTVAYCSYTLECCWPLHTYATAPYICPSLWPSFACPTAPVPAPASNLQCVYAILPTKWAAGRTHPILARPLTARTPFVSRGLSPRGPPRVPTPLSRPPRLLRLPLCQNHRQAPQLQQTSTSPPKSTPQNYGTILSSRRR